VRLTDESYYGTEYSDHVTKVSAKQVVTVIYEDAEN
jgi:hypothetical protein